MPASSSRTTSAAGGRRSPSSASTPAPRLNKVLSRGCSSMNCCGGLQTTAWSACGAPGCHRLMAACGRAAGPPCKQGPAWVWVQQKVIFIWLTSLAPALTPQLGLLGSPPDPVGRFTMGAGPSAAIVAAGQSCFARPARAGLPRCPGRRIGRMSYLVLARKYRPRNFAEMVGQEHVVQALSNALTRQRLHHAYLFTGTRGVGKTTVARILAKSLNCQGPDGEPRITPTPPRISPPPPHPPPPPPRAGEAGAFSVDAPARAPAPTGGGAGVQSLRERAVYKPVQGRFKVF